jgi:hypothetical protein
MRLLTAPRFLKMATTAFGAWWLFSRLAGLASHVKNQLCSRSSSSYNKNNNNSHRVSENLTDVEHVMRSFRISGKNNLLFLKQKTKIFKSFSDQATFPRKRIAYACVMSMQYSSTMRSANPYMYCDFTYFFVFLFYSLCNVYNVQFFYTCSFSFISTFGQGKEIQKFLENIPPTMLLSVTCFFMGDEYLSCLRACPSAEREVTSLNPEVGKMTIDYRLPSTSISTFDATCRQHRLP